MKDGKTLWDELCYKYDLGVHEVRVIRKPGKNATLY
jgi:alpha-glucuronidase